MSDKPKRRWLQFSLMTLFVLMTLVAVFAWGILVAIDRINGWPKVISEIHFDNLSNEAVSDVQIINGDGTVLWDSNHFWGKDVTGARIRHNAGGGREWKNPSERPRVTRRLSIRWLDANGNRRSSTLRITDIEVEDGYINVVLGPGGRVY